MENNPDHIKAINKLLWEEKHIIHKSAKGKGYCSIKRDSKRFMSYIFKGAGSKNLLLQYITHNPQYQIVAQIQDIRGFRQFIPFISWNEAWNSYLHANYYKRYMYEVILSDRPCKPYLDIEWYEDEKEKPVDSFQETNEQFIKQIQTDLITVFKQRYHLALNNHNILISQSHRNNKISFHITINLIIDNQYYAYQTNRSKRQQSAWDLYLALIDHNQDYKNKIDPSVYSLDREFRTLYSSKFDTLTPFMPIVDFETKSKFIDNPLDYFVTHFDPQYQISIIDTPEYIDHKIKDKINNSTKISDYHGHHINDYGDSDAIITRIYELLQSVHPTAKFTNKTEDNRGWRFSYTDRTEPCYTGHIHDKNGFSVFIKPNNGEIYMYCYSTKCGKLFKIGNLHSDKKWRYEAITIDQQYLEYINDIKLRLVPENYTLTGFINDFIKNGGCYVINSKMGTGKTQLLKIIINLYFKDKRILYLSHRQTFTHNIYGAFESLGFHSYLDENQNILHTYDKIIIQIDSLPKLLYGDGNLQHFDFIIMDEIESLLSHLSSPTLTNKRNCVCAIINELIQNSKWVLGLDADFGNRSYDFLSIIRQKPKILINCYNTTKKRFIFNSDYELRVHQLIEDLKNKKNLTIICLSKTALDDIYAKITKIIPDIKLIRYTSMTDDGDKLQLKNVNEIWPKYQAVLYSPTIEAGIDFNVPHFHKIYCFLASGSCCPRSFLQMIGRIRTVTDNRVRCFYEKNMRFEDKSTFIPPVNEVESMILKHDCTLYNKHFIQREDGVSQLVVKSDAFTRTFAYNYLENYEKQVHFMTILKEFIVEREWEYIHEDAGENEDPDGDTLPEESNIVSTTHSTHEEPEVDIFDGVENTTCKSSKITVEMDDLLDAPAISHIERAELEIKQNKGMLTRNEKLALKKYWLMIKFRLNPEDFTMEFLLNWYGKEYILDNLLYALGKKTIENSQDPILNKLPQKIKYLNDILKVYGFSGLLDTKEIQKTDAIEERMKVINLTDWDNYKNLMYCFDRRLLQREKNTFTVSKFTKLSDLILNEFGFKLKSTRKRVRDGALFKYLYVYSLAEARNGLISLIY